MNLRVDNFDAAALLLGANGAAQEQKALTVDFVLLPGYSMLALAAAIEPLSKANMFARTELFRWRLLSPFGAQATSMNGYSINVPDVWQPTDPADITLVCGNDEPGQSSCSPIAGPIRWLWRSGKTVGGIGSGVFVLARAGILADRRFSLHWQHRPALEHTWPDLQPSATLYSIDDRILTCAGAFSSADLMLRVILDNFGEQIATSAMTLCLMKSHRSEGDGQAASVAPRLGIRNTNLIKAIDWIDKNFLDENCLELCTDKACVTLRQLQRLFKTYVGTSPKKYIMELRLQHARSILEGTDLSVISVADLCCFESPSHFSRVFCKRFGVLPSRLKYFQCK